MSHYNNNYMKVMCINARPSNLGQIVVGHTYFIDRMSIRIDSDGDSYGEVCGMDGRNVGTLLLSHFRSIAQICYFKIKEIKDYGADYSLAS